MKITIISSSPRKESNSLKVAKALRKNLQDNGFSQVTLIDFEQYDIPMVGQGDIDSQNLTPFQQNLIEKWAEAQLIFLVVPEYNWFTSGQLFNAIHQLGNKEFQHLFNDKVFALAGVSAGRGGRLPAIELSILLNKMINFLNQYAIVSPRLLESHETGKNVSNEGEVIGLEIYQKSLQAFIEYSLAIGRRWFALS